MRAFRQRFCGAVRGLGDGPRPPAGLAGGESEHAEAGQVDRGGEQGEVGGDLGQPAYPGSSPAVLAAHQVADLAFDLRAGRGVVSLPGRVALAGPGAGQLGLECTDGDGATGRGGGAPFAQRAAGAGRPEARGARPVAAAADRRGDCARAGDGVTVQVDVEAVLGEQSTRARRGRLGLAPGVDPALFEPGLELTAAISAIPEDLPGGSVPGGSVPGGAGCSGPEVSLERASVMWSSARPVIRSVAALASPALPGVTVVAVMISESGSMPTWPL